MQFKKLKIKNLRSYEEQEIEFPAGSLLLSGNVGSGKTTILLAIEYALFGLQAGQRGSALLRNNTEEGEVSLELEIDGNIIIIERRLKKDSKSITNDYSAITINGEKKECSTTELKTKILELIGYPSEFVKKNNLLYKYTLYTPQEQMKNIILEDAETRFSILRHVFGIDKYKTIRANLSLILIRIKDKVKEIQITLKDLETDKLNLINSESKITVLETKIVNVESLLKEKISFRKSIEGEIIVLTGYIKEREKLETELEKAKVFSTSKHDLLRGLEMEELEIKRAIEEFKEKFDEEIYNSINQEIINQKKILEELNISYINNESSLKSILAMKDEVSKKKERIFSIDICPTCLQDVSQNHKHIILNETENKISEAKKKEILLREENSLVLNKLSAVKALVQKLESQRSYLEILRSKATYLEKAKLKLTEMRKSKEKTVKDIELLINHITELKEQIFKSSPNDLIFKRKNLELKQAFSDEKDVEISRAEFKKELQLTHIEIAKLKEEIESKEKLKTSLSSLIDLHDWLSNQFLSLINHIERQVMMKLRQEFSRLFRSWFAMITSESFEVHLDENFTPLIIQNGIEMDYSYLSGGERTAVALAYRLALNQTINSVFSSIKTKDIIILDEPTEGFSATQIERIREIFEQLKVKQLILVSHEQIIEGFVDHVIKIKKDVNSSIIDSSGLIS
ncbi:MAG: SMC family ATPase [Nanoarchaeota archaeon]|nr:SMC family ATPase [Nanoarchaeota archaeon]